VIGLLLGVVGATAGSAVPASASGGPTGGFAGEFAVGPVTAGTSLSYFNYQLSAGATTKGEIAVVGESRRPISLDIFASDAVTAVNSGAVYPGRPGEMCRAYGCWVSGLPATVTLSYHERVVLSFAVAVPTSAPPGQYLAGITVEPAPSDQRHHARSGHGGAVSILVHQVTIGVAVTVGAGYGHDLVIPNAVGTRIGDSPGILLYESNTGVGFEHPAGAVTVVLHGGVRRRFTAVSGLMLPDGRANLRVLASGLKPGSYPASAYLRYDGGSKIAYWSGTLTIPRGSQVPVSVPPGSRVKVIPKLIPGSDNGWIIWVLAAVIAALVAALLWLLLAKKRSRKDEESAPAGGV
jgi:hypothetical protein